MGRALSLLLLNFIMFIRRIYASFAVESVIAICGGILLGLFYYMFSDFLTTEVQTISPKLAASLANGLASVIVLLAAITSGYHLSRSLHAPEHLGNFVERLGEHPTVRRSFLLIHCSSIVLCYYLLPLMLLGRGVVSWDMASWGAVLVMMLLVTMVSFGLSSQKLRSASMHHPARSPFPLLSKPYQHTVFTLVLWRSRQMMYRNHRAQLFLLLALVIALLTLGMMARTYPPLMMVGFAYLAGLCGGAALIVQITQDCRSMWIEKDCGVSHGEFFAGLELLGFGVGLATALVIALGYLLIMMVLGSLPALASDLLLKIVASTFLGPFLVPYLALQIDGKRAGVQILSLVLVSILLATAIFAHWLSVVLLPLVAHYGRISQKDRSYYL